MFIYNGRNERITEAVTIANELLMNDVFYKAIRDKSSFDMATCEPFKIAVYIEQLSLDIHCNVKTYHRRFSRALAYFTASRPRDININTAKLNRSTGSIVATLVHEFVHQVDHEIKDHYFGHGSNSKKGKQNTAAYWIGNLSQSLVDGNDSFSNDDSHLIVHRKSIFAKIKILFFRLF